MSFFARVYNVMIGAPSDIKDEVKIAWNIIHNWSDINSQSTKKILLPLHWSRHTYPTVGKHPQKAINEQIVTKSDLMICIFGSRFGTPTDTHPSGTEEELEEHISSKRNVMVFFRKNINTDDLDIPQYSKLCEFKNRNQNNIYWGEYNDANDFGELLREKLQVFLNNTWLNPNYTGNGQSNTNVEIIISKKDVDVILRSIVVIDVETKGVEINDCLVKIEDDYFAWATIQNGKIEIEGKKVGKTKLIISYKEEFAVCNINVTPINNFCGNPILKFGADKDTIKNLCNGNISEESNTSFFHVESEFTYIYYFNNDNLYMVITFINSLNGYMEYMDVYKTLTERYTFISDYQQNMKWFQCKNEFFALTIENKDKNNLCIIYSQQKKHIDAALNNIMKKQV